MAPILTLPEGFILDVSAYIGQLFTDLGSVVILVVGLPLGFWAVSKVIALARGGFRGRRV